MSCKSSKSKNPTDQNESSPIGRQKRVQTHTHTTAARNPVLSFVALHDWLKVGVKIHGGDEWQDADHKKQPLAPQLLFSPVFTQLKLNSKLCCNVF